MYSTISISHSIVQVFVVYPKFHLVIVYCLIYYVVEFIACCICSSVSLTFALSLHLPTHHIH